MSNAKDIRTQIKSVKNTQKITKAMEMVAASKMKRAQENMQAGRPYTQNILRVLSHLLETKSEEVLLHPILRPRQEVKKVAYILVSTDRGLCGGLNINLFKKLNEHINQQRQQGREICFSVFGRKGSGFLSRLKVEVISAQENYGDNPSINDLLATIQPIFTDYLAGKIDEVYLVGNRFVNTMTQDPSVFRLLPASIQPESALKANFDYHYEPSAGAILESLASHYIEALVKQAMAENIACEMAARMIAMKSASDNAGTLIDDLQLQYNKARQAAITQELSEIVGGAAAV